MKYVIMVRVGTLAGSQIMYMNLQILHLRNAIYLYTQEKGFLPFIPFQYYL